MWICGLFVFIPSCECEFSYRLNRVFQGHATSWLPAPCSQGLQLHLVRPNVATKSQGNLVLHSRKVTTVTIVMQSCSTPYFYLFLRCYISFWGEVFFKGDKMSPSTKTNVRGSPHFRKILGSSGSKDCTKQAAAWSVSSICIPSTLNYDIQINVNCTSIKHVLDMLMMMADTQWLANLNSVRPIITRFLPANPSWLQSL